jgi:hypothetical protein
MKSEATVRPCSEHPDTISCARPAASGCSYNTQGRCDHRFSRKGQATKRQKHECMPISRNALSNISGKHRSATFLSNIDGTKQTSAETFVPSPGRLTLDLIKACDGLSTVSWASSPPDNNQIETFEVFYPYNLTDIVSRR